MSADVAPGTAQQSPSTLRLRIERWWNDRRLAGASGAGVVALWGLVGGWLMPRGPLSTAQALTTMAVSAAVGVAAGLLARSRWAMLGAPLLFAVVYEVVRVGTDGPTVDGVHLSTYGIVALVAGRGLHALLALLPMVLGAAVGAGLARILARRSDPTGKVTGSTSIVRRTVAIVAALMLIAVGVAVGRPATTDPIVDSTGSPASSAVAELVAVDVNGHELAMMIRGHDVDNPVLLFLSGGPGGSEFGAMRRHLPELERHFTVITWDQRGAGKSYPALDPAGTLTVDSMVADTLAVTDHLRGRFGQDRIYLLGQSWGSILGVLAVRSAPEKYAAFIGVGQMVSPLATDTAFYQDTLAWAASTGQSDLHRKLTDIGPPPYASIMDYETVLAHEHAVYPYDHSPNSEGAGGFSENLFVPEYTLPEQVHLLGAFLDTFTALYPQLQSIDFRGSATQFEVPVFFVQGQHEAAGRAEVFDEWYPTVVAPGKDVVFFATSGHRPLFEQPEEFVDYLVGTVLVRTQPPTP